MTDFKMKGVKAVEVNTNCLEGMACPSCGSIGPFWIESKAWVCWTDDGSEEIEDLDFPVSATCMCHACNYSSTVRGFMKWFNAKHPKPV